MDEDVRLLERLRTGDEEAFVTLVTRHHESMLRLASSFVPTHAIAEEVVQDTWLGVVRGLERFEGRSSIKTWLFHILVNRARSAGKRERRVVPLGATPEPAVDASRFGPDGRWASPPAVWAEEIDDRLEAAALADMLRAAFSELPPRQREVVGLRDVDGLTSREVCEVLDITDSHQRVLLHRGRSRLRQAIETARGGM